MMVVTEDPAEVTFGELSVCGTFLSINQSPFETFISYRIMKNEISKHQFYKY